MSSPSCHPPLASYPRITHSNSGWPEKYPIQLASTSLNWISFSPPGACTLGLLTSLLFLQGVKLIPDSFQMNLLCLLPGKPFQNQFINVSVRVPSSKKLCYSFVLFGFLHSFYHHFTVSIFLKLFSFLALSFAGMPPPWP